MVSFYYWFLYGLVKNFFKDKLRRDEIPKKIYICKEPWTPTSGLLTEAFKLKRKNIEKEFEKQIKMLYEDKSGVSKG